ncbi:glutamate ligase domain-containing protein, partial [Phascolarctobacterium succinatutens]
YPGKQVQFVFGMMGDKDMSGVIKTLINQDDVVYTVRADEGARAAEAADLAKLVGSNAVAEANLATAYDAAIRGAGTDGVVCVCGSLYLVGEFKKMLLADKCRMN